MHNYSLQALCATSLLHRSPEKNQIGFFIICYVTAKHIVTRAPRGRATLVGSRVVLRPQLSVVYSFKFRGTMRLVLSGQIRAHHTPHSSIHHGSAGEVETASSEFPSYSVNPQQRLSVRWLTSVRRGWCIYLSMHGIYCCSLHPTAT